jgi:hypothetical protein
MKSTECTEKYPGDHPECEGKFTLAQNHPPYYGLKMTCTCGCHLGICEAQHRRRSDGTQRLHPKGELCEGWTLQEQEAS